MCEWDSGNHEVASLAVSLTAADEFNGFAPEGKLGDSISGVLSGALAAIRLLPDSVSGTDSCELVTKLGRGSMAVESDPNTSKKWFLSQTQNSKMAH